MIIRHLQKLILAFIISILTYPSFSKAPDLSLEQLKKHPPKIIRTCCGFGADIGYAGVPFLKHNDITSIEAIGPHKYMEGRNENNGILYTRRGGFIDMGHLRDCADWTAYIYNLIQASIEDSTYSNIRLGFEGGTKSLQLNIPKDICEDEAVQLAAKIAYDISVWHEIATWFGTAYVPLIPERYSSFSPEDIFSNLMGTHLAVKAILSDMEYDEAMTFYINQMFTDLNVVSSWDETYDAYEKVDNLWYNSSKRFPNKKVLIKRYLDSGTSLHPWLIPEDENIYTPYVLQKPEQSYSDFYELQIKLNYHFPVKAIFSDSTNRIITQKEFPEMIEFLNQRLILEEEREQKKADRSSKRKERRESESKFPSS